MKTMITVLVLFLTTLAVNAQTQFDYLGGMPVNSNVEGCFFMDLNIVLISCLYLNDD